jgi:hypothetical protein
MEDTAMLVFVLTTCLVGVEPTEVTPEQRALEFLAREVPQWSQQHDCLSCHNNGDAARALYVARSLSYDVGPDALKDTSAWLLKPEGWKHNGGEGEFSDKKLANIQFAAVLTTAVETGAVRQPDPLLRAAQMIAEDQEPDGSWKVAADGLAGSPATWGRFLATAMVRRTLIQADRRQFARPIALADAFLRREQPKSVLDAAAVLFALAEADDESAVRQRTHCLDLIRRGEAQDGGWGPYVTSSPEAFDTAVVVLALAQLSKTQAVQPMLNRGRKFLTDSQLADGSWLETTRPAEQESYAQRLSTAGWATWALLVTRRQASAGD